MQWLGNSTFFVPLILFQLAIYYYKYAYILLEW